MKFWMVVISFGLVSGCLKQGPTQDGGSAGNGLSSLELKLPKKDQFGPDAKVELLQSIYVHLQPARSDCNGATKIDEVVTYEKPALDIKVNGACDYKLVLAIGAKADPKAAVPPVASPGQSTVLAPATPADPIGTSLDSAVQSKIAQSVHALYTNFIAMDILATDLAKVTPDAKLPVAVLLQLTSYGLRNGFPKELKTDAPTPEFLSNYKITAADGTVSALSNHVNGRYLLLKFGQDTCLECKTGASALAADAKLKALIAANKCSMIFLVEEGTLPGWTKPAPLGPGLSPEAAAISYAVSGKYAEKTLKDPEGKVIELAPQSRIYDLLDKKIIDTSKATERADFTEFCSKV